MINGEQIGQLILLPHSVKKDQLSGLEDLIAKYPYCSTLHILHQVGLAKTNDIRSEEYLKIAAAHCGDREHLHALVSKKNFEEESFEERIDDILEEVVETSMEADENEPAEEVELIEEESVQEDEAVEEVRAKETEQEEEEEEVADLEESIMSSVVETAFSISMEEEAVEEEEIEEEIEEEVAEEAIKEPIIERPENMSFIEWLKYKQQLIDQANGAVKEKKGKKKKKSKKKKKLDKKLKTKKKEQTVDTTSASSTVDDIRDAKSMSKKEINDLLDKFIEEEPSLQADKKASFFNPTSNAKQSVEDSTDIVSETLAKIHVMQGNYSKAITAYKQLSLLYPEKKAFFASQIEKIKDKQNK